MVMVFLRGRLRTVFLGREEEGEFVLIIVIAWCVGITRSVIGDLLSDILIRLRNFQ